MWFNLLTHQKSSRGWLGPVGYISGGTPSKSVALSVVSCHSGIVKPTLALHRFVWRLDRHRCVKKQAFICIGCQGGQVSMGLPSVWLFTPTLCTLPGFYEHMTRCLPLYQSSLFGLVCLFGWFCFAGLVIEPRASLLRPGKCSLHLTLFLLFLF